MIAEQFKKLKTLGNFWKIIKLSPGIAQYPVCLPNMKV